MNGSIYSRLAVTNLKNNHKTYVPYILTAVLTVMMFYIMDALARNGGIVENNLKLILSYARGVIIVFAVIFLFYTNSFLIKRRKREIGVYNILGMGKRHIARMLFTETLITAVIGIGAGLVAGLVFSKLMYLALFKLLHFDVGLEFSVLSAVRRSGRLSETDLIIVETSLRADTAPFEELGYSIEREKCYKNQKHLFLRIS